MHIKRLEIRNFKSLKKVAIPFYSDFTAISGPNGCGKSNIIDAIVFVLGISRSKGMRAEKLTDLIFKGDGIEKSHAEVSLILDNDDGMLRFDGDEVEIKRNIKKTDKGYYSYYYINGHPVSLSDLHDTLSVANISSDGYSVVMQGDVTNIIEMSDYRRRRIIDDIAGVAEFDEKKEEALEELEIVKERIEMADIILNEIKDRLNQLKYEKEQALKYKSLKEEKEIYENYMTILELRYLHRRDNILKEELERYESDKDAFSCSISEIKSKLIVLNGASEEINSEISKAGGGKIDVKREIEEISERISKSKGKIEAMEKEIGSIGDRMKKKFIESNRAREEVDEMDEIIKKMAVGLNIFNLERDEMDDELNRIKSKIDKIGAAHAEEIKRLDEIGFEMREKRYEKDESLREEDRILSFSRRRSSEKDGLIGKRSDLSERLEEIENSMEKTLEEIGELRREKNKISGELGDLKERYSSEKLEADMLEGKIDELKEMCAKIEAKIKASEELDAYSKGASFILNAKRSGELRGIYGSVAELGKVDERYSVALEVAAGGRLQHIVTDTDEDATNAISLLKRENMGRATFLPLNRIRKSRISQREPKLNGFIDYTLNLVKYDEKFEDVFGYVFGDTLVFDNLEDARCGMKNSYRMVTLDGELIERSGAMTGGSFKRRLKFSVDRRDELQKISAEIIKREMKLEEVREKLADMREEIERRRDRLTEIERRSYKCEAVLSGFEKEKEDVSKQIGEIERDINQIEEEGRNYSDEMDSLEKKIREIDLEFKELEAKKNELADGIRSSMLPSLTERRDSLIEEVSRLNDKIRGIEDELRERSLNKKHTEERIEELKKELEDGEKDRSMLKNDIEGEKKKIEEMKALVEEKRKIEEEADEKTLKLREKRDAILNEISSLEREELSINKNIEIINTKKESVKEKLDELRERISSFDEKVATMDVPEDLPPKREIEKKIEEFVGEIKSMEPVNMRSIDEYGSVDGRYRDLAEKRDVLNRERDDLLERIGKFDGMKREAFMNTFNGINENFKEIYGGISGGSGELVLEDEEDPFNGGLWIRAMPEGKNVAQRLQAMSGGEKSLIALSLIFSAQKFQPSPFYIFDEVDMFLDGVNAGKVSSMIRSFSSDAQFIVISLRKKMLEGAHGVLGVTLMDGISHITGVRLN
ncbi:MAG: Chromosome partition protein Smc [Candidatus Methanolliviera sp. GoM_oil]|nr:MAG: Chromosome partition protein Smc [Candidatus Methanolliviera sp. GoM_oil]